jgi:hypothetical protein
MYDKDEQAARLNLHIRGQAKELMPRTVLVTVSGNPDHNDLGYAWGDRAGKAVPVLLPPGLDVSSGEHVLYCLPPNQENPSDPYIALGLEWNGVDGSRIPRMVFKDSTGETFYGVGAHNHDAGDITYTPAVAADWDSDTDPGDLDDAVNQLAERVDDLEGAGGGGVSAAIIADQKSSGTAGGTFTNGAWRIRTLNTEVADPDGLVTISSNRFTPIAGTYLIYIEAMAHAVGTSQLQLYNYTQSSVTSTGLSAGLPSGLQLATLTDIITANGTDEYEVQHRCTTTVATTGLGYPSVLGIPETYCAVRLEKIG